MNGLVEDVSIERDDGLSRLVVKLKDGRVVKSLPDEPGVIAKSFFIVKKYIEWGKLINTGQ